MIGSTGPKISLWMVAWSEARGSRSNSRRRSLLHQRIIVLHIDHDCRRHVLLGDVDFAADDDRALRFRQQLLDTQGVLLSDDAAKGLRLRRSLGVELSMTSAHDAISAAALQKTSYTRTRFSMQ